MRILLTGAAGAVATALRPRLARPGRVLRLADVVPIADRQAGEETILADLTDESATAAAMDGVDAVVHLGGLSREHPWEDILRVNVHGTQVLLEAARRENVRQVVLVGSHHAAGFHPRPYAPDGLSPRPDTYYGFSKAAMEALGSLYHDRFSMNVVVIRLGSCAERPRDLRALSTWLSYDDCARLVEASLTARGFHLVWGVSANTRRWWSLDAARALGYAPRDDAEVHAPRLLAESGEPDLTDPVQNLVGGVFCERELGVFW
ncbi:NAD-dependent epimerase/dehydratase family protein [Streptosporangium sp. NPDC002721]|uniref:NAD-dependent epimerase/dehydratase family protein n=1 Tax=Streptosporangium sp. NPDC002721 TaxID=3366188 RepID=UPI00368FBE28